MKDNRRIGSAPDEHLEARAAMVADAREAFEHDLERQRKQAELIDDLSRASLEMQHEVERREHLMTAMLDAQSPPDEKDPPT
jgi:transcription elongation GreA/GreB family factor